MRVLSDNYAVSRLSPLTKSVYALGDLTCNTVLGALSLVYASYYLIEIAGLRPLLAGLVPLVGRTVDAFTDPAMGRLSDHTRWRSGRRRPYFLLGALPFGASFAMMWIDPGLASEAARFAYYTAAYCLLTTFMTVLSVPYMALQSEMAIDYHERTSLNTYRNAAAVLGLVAAIGMRPLAEALGGQGGGFARAGMVVGLLLVLPWLAVHRVSFERPEFGRRTLRLGVVEGFKVLAAQRNFRTLVALYVAGRVAIDLVGALLIIYCTYWLGSSRSFEPIMLVFFASVLLALPLWLNLARRYDKAVLFVAGAMCWMAAQLLLLLVQPDWPLWTVLAFAPLLAVGYAVVDLMPWAMVGDVIDEDDLSTGERREGLYNGVFLFLRKLGGALGVFLALAALDYWGLEAGKEQSDSALLAVRLMTALAPALFVGLAARIALGYRLGRDAHAGVLELLRRRDQRA